MRLPARILGGLFSITRGRSIGRGEGGWVLTLRDEEG